MECLDKSIQADQSIEVVLSAEVIEGLEMQLLSHEQSQALEKLLKTQQRRLTHFIRKHLRRDDFVDDLIQQTHLTAFRNWTRFRGDSKPETWLFGIALNLVKNFRHRDTSSFYEMTDFEEELSHLAASVSFEPEFYVIQQERIETLRGAIAQLPNKMQQVVQLVLLDGLSYQDAADELSLPIGTVRSRLSRARDLLRLEVDSGQVLDVHH